MVYGDPDPSVRRCTVDIQGDRTCRCKTYFSAMCGPLPERFTSAGKSNKNRRTRGITFHRSAEFARCQRASPTNPKVCLVRWYSTLQYDHANSWCVRSTWTAQRSWLSKGTRTDSESADRPCHSFSAVAVFLLFVKHAWERVPSTYLRKVYVFLPSCVR